jgi:hypothetical protein
MLRLLLADTSSAYRDALREYDEAWQEILHDAEDQ